MKLKDYIKQVRNHILCYEYSTTSDLANHIVEENFIKFAGDLLDKVGGIKEAKFVFCDESIEFMFHTEDNLDYSFEYFYDTTEEMIASVGIPSKSTWSDGQKKRDYLAGSIQCFDLDSSLTFVENCKRELAARIALGLIG